MTRLLLAALGALLVLTGCTSAARETSAPQPAVAVMGGDAGILPTTVRGTDGAEVIVSDTSRIVALNGGITETLFALGLGDSLVGRDVSSDLPEAEPIEVVTQGHDVSPEGVLALNPSLVLADARTGPPEALAAIRNAGVPVVLVPEVWSLEEMPKRVRAIADAVGRSDAADAIIAASTSSPPRVRGEPVVAFLYLRGNAAVYLLGGDGSGADSLLEAVGAVDAGSRAGLGAFTPLTPEALAEAQPDARQQQNEDAKAKLGDGEGSRVGRRCGRAARVARRGPDPGCQEPPGHRRPGRPAAQLRAADAADSARDRRAVGRGMTATLERSSVRRGHRLALPLLAAAFVVSCLLALAIGAYAIGVSDAIAALWRSITGQPLTVADSVIVDIRAPRVALAVIVGASLATAGVVMQGIFANPLAEPGLVGVSSGAAVAAVVAIVLGLTAIGFWVLPLAAMIGGLLVTAGVYVMARVGGRTEVVTLILTGVAVNAFAGALIGLLMSVSDDAELRSITFWTLGSLSAATWSTVLLVLPLAVVGLFLAPRLARSLDLLALGENTAAHLGVDVEWLRKVAIVLTALLTAAAVAVAGIIGFIGLVVPHAIRLVLGPGHRLLLPASALAGSTLLVLADLVARTVVAPREIPLGVLTALIGSPVFFLLLRREHRRRGAWA